MCIWILSPVLDFLTVDLRRLTEVWLSNYSRWAESSPQPPQAPSSERCQAASPPHPRASPRSYSAPEPGRHEASLRACCGGRGAWCWEPVGSGQRTVTPLLLLGWRHRPQPQPPSQEHPSPSTSNITTQRPCSASKMSPRYGVEGPLTPRGSWRASRCRLGLLWRSLGSALSAPCARRAGSQLLPLPAKADTVLRENLGAHQKCV